MSVYNTLFEKGKAYIEAKNWVKAFETFNDIRTMDTCKQNQYISCLQLFNIYELMGIPDEGLPYLEESHVYDTERVEGIYRLIVNYNLHKKYDLAFQQYRRIQEYYEQRYVHDSSIMGRLAFDKPVYDFFLPYHNIITSERTRNYSIGIKMYEIIFRQKHHVDPWYINNLIFNLQFFISHIPKPNLEFVDLFIGYLNFLHESHISVDNVLIKQYIGDLDPPRMKEIHGIMEQCKKSKKILFYCGGAMIPWNHTVMETVGIGGSETCVAKLAKQFPTDYEIYVSGNVAEEKINNVTYVHFNNLEQFVRNNYFYAVIISRYIGFLDDIPYFSSYKLFMWIHDLCFVTFKWVGHAYPPDILQKWISNIDNVICLSEWHRNHFQGLYPILSDKIIIIPNGITSSTFKPDTVKKKNRFIFTSCPERGYAKLFELWPEITKRIPDAELKLATYTGFPRNDEEKAQMKWIEKTSNIEYLGCLKPSELYSLMGSAEYWLYPTNFCETFCITALEMLHNKVICLYYPVAALQNTLGEYGIVISQGSEIDAILKIVDDTTTKEQIKEKGLQYARTFDWSTVVTKWNELIFSNNNPRTLLKQAQDSMDAQNEEASIGILKKILTLDNCNEEKYISCLKLFLLYKKLNATERGIPYLLESYKYNTDSIECIYHLIQYFVDQKKWTSAYQHYQRIQSHYERNIADTDHVEVNKSMYEFLLPYFMILVSEQTRNYSTGLFMYDIIFKKKNIGIYTEYYQNIVQSFQFFIPHISNGKKEYTDLFIEYVNKLYSLEKPIDIRVISQCIMELDSNRKNEIHLLQSATEKCKNSKKILFWCGYPVKPWNYSSCVEKGLGGAETCVVHLARHFPDDCEIYVCGGVAEEKVKNVSYIGIDKLSDLLRNNYFHTIIVSRFIGFFEDYPHFLTYKLCVWIHDLEFIPFKNFGTISFHDVLNTWVSRIDTFICLTEWHRTHMVDKYPLIADKTVVIPNGICSSYFQISDKRKNRFIFTSAPERGYANLFELWPEITKNIPDAELIIATYTGFPRNDYEKTQMEFIQRTPNVEFVGCLSPKDLYSLMGSAEYWLYPTDFCETFCITALEMLHNKVVCLYYPVAALNNTLGDYGIKVIRGSEIEAIKNIMNDTEKKQRMIDTGMIYARTFDWSSVVRKWITLLEL